MSVSIASAASHGSLGPARSPAIETRSLLPLALGAMALLACLWLGYEFWRLLFQPDPLGAIDLKQRHREVDAWFAGRAVYGAIDTAVYPPASHLLLWPLLGWLPVESARWLWAASSVAMLVWLARIWCGATSARSPFEGAFGALLPLSMYATGATIGNGQLIVHLLPCLLASLTLLRGAPPSWPRDLLAASLFLVALIKPTIAAPFFWLVVFVPGRLRPALLVASGYAGLTLSASGFQPDGPVALMEAWVDRALVGAEYGSAREGYADQHSGLASLEIEGAAAHTSLAMLALLGAWVLWNRRADLWLLIAVSALVARLWTYHQWYDDLLLFPVLAALYRRVASGGASARGAGLAFAATLLFALSPGGRYLIPEALRGLYGTAQLLVWLGVLAFLIRCVSGDRRGGDARPTSGVRLRGWSPATRPG